MTSSLNGEVHTHNGAGPLPTGTGAEGQVHVRVERPHPRSIIVSLVGEVDLSASPRLRELLRQRMTAAVDTVVLDLSGLSFFDSSGAELLCETQRRASAQGISLRLVTTRCVDRVLGVIGCAERFRTFRSTAGALGR